MGKFKLGQLNSIVDSIMSELSIARNESISSLVSFLRSDTDTTASVDRLFHHLKDELSDTQSRTFLIFACVTINI